MQRKNKIKRFIKAFEDFLNDNGKSKKQLTPSELLDREFFAIPH